MSDTERGSRVTEGSIPILSMSKGQLYQKFHRRLLHAAHALLQSITRPSMPGSEAPDLRNI